MAGIFAALVLAFSSASGAALAHDAVTDTYPASGQTVAAGQFEVSITFAEKVLNSDNNAGLAIQVVGPLGKERKIQSPDCIHRGDKKIATPVNLAANGTYQVAWRSVSSDGHPVEGSFLFKVKNTSGYQADGLPAVNERCIALKPIAQQTATAYPTPSASASAEPTESALAPSKSDVMSQALPGFIVAILLVIAGSVAGVVRGERIRAKSGKPRDDRYE